MATVTIGIGNSDDKLTQDLWSRYVASVSRLVNEAPIITIHFAGFSDPTKPWQNACWVIEIDEGSPLLYLCDQLSHIAKQYQQESVAVTVGKTRLVKSAY